MKLDVARTVKNLKDRLNAGNTEVWVPRTHEDHAKMIFAQYMREGKIVSFEKRENWSCNGSLNFLVEYPS